MNRFARKRMAASGPSSHRVQLQPLTVIGGVAPWAAWAFDGVGVSAGFDRTGNARALTVPPSLLGTPSHRGNAHTSAGWYGSNAGDFSMSLANTWDAGSLTLCGWLNTAYLGVAARIEGWWWGFGPGVGANQCLLGVTTSNKFLYVADPAGGVTSAMDFPSAGTWRFVSVRRDVVNGWVRWGVDGVYEQKSIGAPAASAAGAALRAGCMAFGTPSSNFCALGSMEDWVYWKTLLTDAQVNAQWVASR